MSDTEYEKFEINDYDLENEFNPNRMGRRRPTKNQQIYGIWADDDSDDDAGQSTSKGRNRTNVRKAKDYAAPIGFVAGGVQQSGKKKDEETMKSDEEKSNDDKGGNTSSESESEARPQISFGGGKKNQSSFQFTSNSISNRGLGGWEQHTRGIGAKLLLQMGYEPGRGLGKDLQGISQPVQAHVRKGRGAIGAYGTEQPGQTIGDAKSNKPKIDDDEREAKEFKEKMDQWRKDTNDSKSKKKRNYKSVEDIIEKGKKPTYILSDKLSSKMNTVVIDMTGPEKRVLSGYHALGQTKVADENLYKERTVKECTNFSLPELTHNLDLILDLCEQEIIQIDKNQKTASDRKVVLRQDRDSLEKIVKLEQDHIETIEHVLELVESLTSPKQPLTLSESAEIFMGILNDYPDEYIEFGLSDLVPGVIAPLFQQELREWDVFEMPAYPVKLIQRFEFLNDNKSENNIFSPYSSLIWFGIIPNIRTAINEWNPRNHEPMANLLDIWAKLFPAHILDNVLEKQILPRIVKGVELWDPTTDTLPVHFWVTPWHTLLGASMKETVYPVIMEKLSKALVSWSPSDGSARNIISPWSGIFPDSDFQNFLQKNIVPKLQLVLSELIINPLHQDMHQFKCVWEWHELISTSAMSQMLSKYFFPKWMQTLVIWLNQNPNFEQVSRWYSGWKSQFSDEILQQNTIKEHFRRALDLMQRSTGAILPSNMQIPTPIIEPIVNVPPPPSLMDLHIAPAPQLEFKELVSQKCAERGIIFAPMPGRREHGKQVYRVGKLFCYIDRTVVMLSDGSFVNWIPVSINSLLDRAITGAF
ncbi:septin-interacting protein 1 [Contarinia nasturtii]|uniref:septin-interacting protein 1 n=1 Tax=Contarinia nasturtii TaxID=265458 RepID=UPI0012D49050|nr:septin-interacting protein 1 [Contarinia nasturtii]